MKNIVKRVLALSLILLMLLSLSACGKSKEETQQPEETPGAENAMAYKAEFTDLKGEGSYFSPLFYTEDGFYAFSNEKVGTNIPEGAEVVYEGQYDVYETRLYFIGLDGKITKLQNYAPLPAAENTENYVEFYSGSNIVGGLLDAEGELVVVEERYVSCFTGTREQMESDDGNLWKYTDENYIRVLDKTGKELSCNPIDFDTTNGYISFYGAVADEDGNLLGTSDMQIVAVAPDGSVAYTVSADDYVNSLVRLKDGRVGYLTYGENGQELCILDTETHSATGERVKAPNDAWSLIPGVGDYDFYYTSGVSFYGYRTETQESEKLFNWLDLDVNSMNLNQSTVRPDGTILSLLTVNDSDQYKGQLVTVKQVPADSLPQKEILTLAVSDLSYNYALSDAVIKFNRASDNCRIQVKDYSQYNTEDDYSAGLTKLTTEIMAGNMPDLLSLNSSMPYRQLAAKGLLEDLYPYLDKDGKLSRDDFFANVLKAMEVDGKLCEVCSSFTVQSLLGASSVVGSKPGWTYEQFDAALASMPAGCTPMDQYTTREDILRTLVCLEMENLVDWSTGKVNFDSKDFVDMLNFAARFPASFDWDNYEYTPGDDAETRIQEGRQMLMNTGISDISNLIYNNVYFSGDTTYIGYPTNEGVGNILSLGGDGEFTYAMSRSCKDKEAGWQFLRSFLTEETAASPYYWGLPVNINAFNARLQKAMTPQYKKDANGNYVLDNQGNKIEVAQGQYGTADGQLHNVYAMTQEQADQLMELITTATKTMDSNDSIFDIVNEQAQAFFNGQKSAEEVARLIQSKANIYVNEQR